MRADCWHGQHTTGRGPHPMPAAGCPSPRYCQRQSRPRSSLASPPSPRLACLAQSLGTSKHLERALQEAVACGPGQGGGGGDETGCVHVILLQGRQEGQMGFLVSVLAPCDKESSEDCGRALVGRAPAPRPWISTHSGAALPTGVGAWWALCVVVA